MITKKALANLENIKSEIPIWIKDAILLNKEDILNVLKYGQLGKGQNSSGNPLRWEKGDGTYAPVTQEIANQSRDYSFDFPKSNGQPYNFFWSGNTFNFMNLKIDSSRKEYDIFTTGGKQDLLESIYGEIFDLTKENNAWINENIIEPYIVVKLNEKLFNF